MDFRPLLVAATRDAALDSFEKFVTFAPDEDKTNVTGPVVAPEILDAYAFFLENTVSADSAFVEDVLRACFAKTFLLPVPAFASVAAVATTIVDRIVHAHPFAEAILLHIAAEKYPHPVRAAAEHKSYARGLLGVAKSGVSAKMVGGLVGIVVEKLAIIDAMAPENVAVDAEGDGEISHESEKMDVVLSEVLEFCSGFADELPHVVQTRLSAVVAAAERYILPAGSMANAPNLLLHATAVCGRTSVLKVIERFRVSFFDPSLPHQMRTTYLCYSAALLVRSAATKTSDIVSWLSRLTRWLHLYIRERGDRVVVDVDVHHLFYSAVFSLMWVISLRPSVLSCSNDIANSMRFLSIMSSDMNPFLVMPPMLVASFSRVVEDLGGMNFDTVFADNAEVTLPTQTRFGNVNKYSSFFPLASMCSLPLSSAIMGGSYFKFDRIRKGRASLGQIGSLLDLQTLNNEALVVPVSKKRYRSHDICPSSPSAIDHGHAAKRQRIVE